MHSILLLYKSFYLQFRSYKAYSVNFWLGIIGVLFMYFSQFLVMWTMLNYFQELDGWNKYEIGFMYGNWLVSYGLIIFFFGGVRDFTWVIYDGDFDLIMVRPHNLLLQVISGRMELMAWAHFSFGALVFFYCLFNLGIDLAIVDILRILNIVFTGVFIQGGMLLFFATLSFWMIQTGPFFGLFMSLNAYYLIFPITAYGNYVRMVFTIIPLGFITYFPVSWFLGKDIPFTGGDVLANYSLLVGIAFLLLNYFLWMLGTRHYKSVGN